MPPIFQRFRKVLSRRGKRSPFAVQLKECIWERLPDQVLIRLVSLCDLDDIISLALTSRLLHRRVFHNELAISHSFLDLRRQRNQWDAENVDVSPGDDLTFISELFPPPPPQYAVGDGHVDADYSFAYLIDLKRCWTTCIQLSYYLADHAVRYHLDTDPVAQPLWSSSKTEKEVVYSKAVAAVHERLLYPMAYAILFLESCAADGSDSGSSVHIAKIFKSIDEQQSVLQDAPFTSTNVLLSTQHCLELLCSTVRRLMHPEFPYSSSESWLSLLLMTSTLERVLQFFTSVAKDEEKREPLPHTTSWSRRKEFMWHMREDLGHYVASSAHSPGKTFSEPPTLDQVWFEACHREMIRRRVIPHAPEEPISVLHGSAVTLNCKHCYVEE